MFQDDGEIVPRKPTCVALAEDLTALFGLARRLTEAGQRPVLANNIDVLAELLGRQEFEVAIIEAPQESTLPYVVSSAARVREAAASVRIVYAVDDHTFPWRDHLPRDTAYFVERAATPGRLQAIIDIATFSDGLTGVIKTLSLTDFLQLLIMKRASTAIRVRGGDCDGALVIQQGQIVDASCGVLRGNDALYKILNQPRGRFNEELMPASVENTVSGNSDFLLLDAMRRQDEAAQSPTAQETEPEKAEEAEDFDSEISFGDLDLG